MLCRTLLAFVVLAVLLVASRRADGAPRSGARQYLQPLPGYVPVYIRPGDTPLEDINPDLAEAFESYARKQGRLSFGRASHHQQQHRVDEEEKEDPHHQRLDDLSLDETPKGAVRVVVVGESQHIQKIPRP